MYIVNYTQNENIKRMRLKIQMEILMQLIKLYKFILPVCSPEEPLSGRYKGAFITLSFYFVTYLHTHNKTEVSSEF